MQTFLRNRLSIFTALLLTALALYGLISRQAIDSNWMLRWNKVESGQVQQIYLILIIILIVALPFSIQIQKIFNKCWIFIFILAVAASFLSVTLVERNEQTRLFITPFSIWIIIIHIVALAVLVVWFATSSGVSLLPQLPTRTRVLLRYGLVLIIVVLGVLYVAARAEFLPLDLPDEPFNASIATNYAQNNDLSGTYIGSAYGSPDVVFPRYYWAMGVWLKLVGNTSLASLRAFPVLVAALSLVVFLLAMWKLRRPFGLTAFHLLIGAVALLSMSTFLRTSHDLRMDILLALYSSLMLWGMLGFWQFKGQIRYLVLMGLALFFGMEAIPLAAVPLSVATGITLIVWWLRQPQKKSMFRYVIFYGVACAVGILVYYLSQFLPNIAESWGRYRGFVQSYSGTTGVGTVRLPLTTLVNYIGRFSLVLSPVELLLSALAVITLWRMKVMSERWMLASVGLGALFMLILFRLSYSYFVVFTPFAAYAIARVTLAWHPKRTPLMVILLTALVAVPIFDLIWSIQAQPNQNHLEAINGLTPHVPSGTTIVGEDDFWFTLHDQRTYIGINGLANYSAILNVDYLTAFNKLKVDALLCDSGTTACQTLVDTGYFGLPTEYKIGNSTYLLYWHSKP